MTQIDYDALGLKYLKASDLSDAVVFRVAGDVLAKFFSTQADIIRESISVTLSDSTEPYPDVDTMRADIHDNAHIYIARTEEGTTPLWSAVANGDMRLWHDYTHHYGHNLGFGLADEHRAFILALRELSAWWGSDDNMLEAMSAILYSEMVLQGSAAMWLGGYDQTRDGLTFTQKIVRI